MIQLIVTLAESLMSGFDLASVAIARVCTFNCFPHLLVPLFGVSIGPHSPEQPRSPRCVIIPVPARSAIRNMRFNRMFLILT